MEMFEYKILAGTIMITYGPIICNLFKSTVIASLIPLLMTFGCILIKNSLRQYIREKETPN